MHALGAGVHAVSLVVIATLVAVSLVVPGAELSSHPALSFGRTTGAGVMAAPGYAETQRAYIGGMIRYTPVQTVGGVAYWASFCPTSEPCMKPEGVAYVPQANAVVLTEVNSTFGPGPNGTNAVMEFNPVTFRASGPLDLFCTPGIPFYPGSGPRVYIPCFTEGDWKLVLVLDASTHWLVGNISVPEGAVTLTFDPSNGMIYALNWSNGVSTIDPTSMQVVGFATVRGFGAIGYLPEEWPTLSYDKWTGDLLAADGTSGVWSLNISHWTRTDLFATGQVAQSVSIDDATGELYLSTTVFGPTGPTGSYVLVYNAATYSPEATISIPGWFGRVNLVLIDAGHGDAYFVGQDGVLAWNVSARTFVGSVTISVADFLASATFVPATDQIFVSPEGMAAPWLIPGTMVQLYHTTGWQLTTFLWLPTAVGILALGVGVGIFAALIPTLWRRR